MQIDLADERVMILRDRFSMDLAEGRAWTRRLEAFGALAKLTGLLSRPRDEEFATVYRERRLQPFWRIACTATIDYQRAREYRVPLDPAVRSITVEGRERAIDRGAFLVDGIERCRDEATRETLFDAVAGRADPRLSAYLTATADEGDAALLAAKAAEGTIVVPPEAKASMLARDVLAGMIRRIDADQVLEETVLFHHVDLFYRPVYAFRYAWQGKEAVVEFDGVTGEVRTGGSTFEQHLGVMLDPHFLINAGVEAAGLFIPGARLAEIVITKGVEASRRGMAAT